MRKKYDEQKYKVQRNKGVGEPYSQQKNTRAHKVGV